MRPVFAQPSGNDQKRRRRCALPAQSKTSRVLERQGLQQGCWWSAPPFLECGGKRSATPLWILQAWNVCGQCLRNRRGTIQSAVAAALRDALPICRTCWRGSVCNRAVGGARHRFWSAAGSEAPRRLEFCRRGTYEASVCATVGERSKAPSPLRSAGAVQDVARAGEAGFATGLLVERATVFGVRREAKRHAALDSAGVERMWPVFAQPSGNDPKRRRRCATRRSSDLPHVLERQCLQQGCWWSAPPFLECGGKR